MLHGGGWMFPHACSSVVNIAGSSFRIFRVFRGCSIRILVVGAFLDVAWWWLDVSTCLFICSSFCRFFLSHISRLSWLLNSDLSSWSFSGCCMVVVGCFHMPVHL